MKSVVLTANRTVRVEEVPIPRLARDEVMIRTEYSGICGSDIHAFEGRHPFRKPPVALGHEISGVITRVGEDVAGRTVGERVAVMPVVSCGACATCLSGRPNICPHRVLPGTEGWGGTFSEYFVAKSSITFPLGARTSLKVGALAEPLSVGVHAAKIDGNCSGKRIAILGAGTIGLMTGLACHHYGACTIVLSDMYEFNLELAETLFGGRGYRADAERLLPQMLENAADGFDTVFMSSGASVNLAQALALVRPGGSIVVSGLYLEPIPVDLTSLTLREVRLLGSQIYTEDDFQAALEILDTGGSKVEALITQSLPYASAQEAFETIVERARDNVKTLLSFGSGENG